MTNRLTYYIDIEDTSGNKLGDGPITTAAYWRQTKAMDQAGEFATWIPLSDPKAENIDMELVLRCHAVYPSGVVEVGSGVVDDVRYERNNAGAWGMRISGMDEMRLLQDRTVKFLQLGGSGSPPTVSHATSISSIGSYAPSGWTFTPDSTPPFNEIIYRFRSQSVLNAFTHIAQFTKTHFVLSAAKTLTFKSDFSASGITCTDRKPIGHATDSTICYIKDFNYIRETKDISTRLYGYGAWYDGVFTDIFIPLGDVNYGITPSDPDYWPSPKYTGYTDNRSADWVEKDSSKATWGLREKAIQYPEIKVTFFTGGYSDAVWRDLCRLIYNRTVTELDWYSIEAQFISLELLNCSEIIEPLTTVRVMIDVIEDGRSVLKIDDDLLVLSSQIEITPDGVRTTNIEVTDAERYRRSDPYATVAFQNLALNDQYT